VRREQRDVDGHRRVPAELARQVVRRVAERRKLRGARGRRGCAVIVLADVLAFIEAESTPIEHLFQLLSVALAAAQRRQGAILDAAVAGAETAADVAEAAKLMAQAAKLKGTP
jgi:hypothetical protein